MDNENVITPTGNLSELDMDYNNWLSLSFNQRKLSDVSCIGKYGMTNTDLYNLIKRNEELASSDNSLHEGSIEKGFEPIDTIVILLKLQKSSQLSNELGVVIINPWILDNQPDYSLGELEKKYELFLGLNDNIKRYSNDCSQDLWGYDVYNMYNIMKNKFSSVNTTTDDSFKIPINDKQLSEFVNFVTKEKENNDIINIKCRQLDCLSNIYNLYENTILERLSENLDNSNNGFADYSDEIPMITPWFTPDEMNELFNIEVDPYEFVVDGSKAMKLHEDIRNKMLEGNVDEIIKLGWNPSVPYNESSISYARQRQIKWFNENKNTQIINISNFDFFSEGSNINENKLEPIYITLINHEGINSKIIRGWTHSRWSHAGISLDENLNKIYSYNLVGPDGKGGFSIESLDFYNNAKNPNLKVIVFFVHPTVKSRLKSKINYYKDNIDKTYYNIKNIVKLVINKADDAANNLGMICSQFVDNILKTVKLDLTGKPSNLVSPADFERSTKISRMFTIFDGSIKDYKPVISKNKISNLLKSKLNPDGLIMKPIDEVVNDIIINKSFNSIYNYTTNDDRINKILAEMRTLLNPSNIIIEAKPLPIRVGKSGNVFIDLPRDLESEYQQSHRLLTSYSENNIEGIKHQVARLFYINSIIEKKIRKMKKGDKDYKDLVDLRARIINDFKKYMDIIQKVENNFDFELYIRNSEYYDKTVMIDKHTMKYTGSVIKNMIKLMK